MSAPMLAATLAADILMGIACEMGVAGRRLDFGVPEQLTDHGQALAERQGAGGERMTQIMKPDIFEPGTLSHAIPVTVEVRQGAPPVCGPQ